MNGASNPKYCTHLVLSDKNHSFSKRKKEECSEICAKSVQGLCKQRKQSSMSVSKQVCYFKRYKTRNVEMDRAQEMDLDPFYKALPSCIDLFPLD